MIFAFSCRDDGGRGSSADPIEEEDSGPDDEQDPREDGGDEADAQVDEPEPLDAGRDGALADGGDARAPSSDGGTDAGAVADAADDAADDAAVMDAAPNADGSSSNGDAAAAADAGDAAATGEAGADAGDDGGATQVRCIDEQIAQMLLFEAPAAGLITEEGTQAGSFATLIDATAGGLNTTQSFVYARFTSAGLEKLAIGDEAAFSSSAWHIAARRYVLRVNSGVSGPGSVRAARTAPGTSFDVLNSVPDGLSYRDEQYYTESCEYVPDTSGVGAPASALSSFWSYAGCVKMTDNVFVLELPDQHHVKLQVTGYYPPDNQRQCNETDAITFPSGAGNLRMRWAFLD
ncbi:MAG TPA: HmuY family protein [Polyangiales bacterium]